jgi:creatinine amidohydrolase
MRPYILSETNYGYTKANQYEVAVLPLGATEPHNLHLPYGTDCYEGTTIGEKICEEAHRRGAKVVLLPTIPYGTETNMHRFPLAMNVDPTTLYRFVTDIIHSCLNSGVRKIVLLNSHGGNEMKPLLRELADKIDGQLFLCNWYTVLGGEEAMRIFQHGDDHAGEMETSFILAYYPASWRPTTGRPPRPASTPSIAAGSRSPAPGTSSRPTPVPAIPTLRAPKRHTR